VLTVLSVLRLLVGLEPESSLAELIAVNPVQVTGRGLGFLKRSFGGEAGRLEHQVRKELSPVDQAAVIYVHVAHHALHGLCVDKLPVHGHSVVIASELFGIVNLRVHQVDQNGVGEVLVVLSEFLDVSHFPVEALELGNGELVVTSVFHELELWRGRGDEVQDRLVNGEVHELDAELILDLGLRLDGVLGNGAHLFDRVHLGLLGNKDPVIELFVQLDGVGSVLLQVHEGPVADLN